MEAKEIKELEDKVKQLERQKTIETWIRLIGSLIILGILIWGLIRL